MLLLTSAERIFKMRRVHLSGLPFTRVKKVKDTLRAFFEREAKDTKEEMLLLEKKTADAAAAKSGSKRQLKAVVLQ